MTKLPDDNAVGVTVAVTGVFLIVLLIDAVVVCPVVVVSVTVDDVGCGDSVVVVTVVGSVTSSVQTYVTYTPCKCSISFLQGFFVFRLSLIHISEPTRPY